MTGPDPQAPEIDPGNRPAMTLSETIDATADHLRRFVHFSRPEHADAVALWAAHTHVPLERLAQSPILALTSVLKQSGKSKLLDTLEFVVRDPWRISRPSESVLFRKIDRDHPTVLLDEIDTVFNDKGGNTEGIRSIFNSGNRPGTKVPRSVPAGRGYTLAEFDVFCPKATAGIGGLPETILDRAIVIRMERRAAHDRVEKLRDRRARELGEPLRQALAYHVSRIEQLTVADDELPSELDDRAQDGWESLIKIADVAGGTWPARARRAAISIFTSRSAVDDNLSLRLLRIPVKAISQSGVFDHPRSEAAKRPTRRVASPLDAHLLPGVLRVVSHGGFGRWGGAVDLGVLPPKGVAA